MPASFDSSPLSERQSENRILFPGPALVAKADRLYGECLQKVLAGYLADNDVQRVSSLAKARTSMKAMRPCALLVCGVGFRDGDALSWLAQVCSSRAAKRILVVTARKELWIHTSLRDMAVNGVFNAFEGGMEAFGQALHVVASGGYYLSPSFRGLLYRPEDDAARIFRQLTIKEQLVLSVIGDGSDDHEAAARLDMSRAAVRSHRKRLHAKLGVNHKGELIREAVRYGFVRMSSEGISRPGFENLISRTSNPPYQQSSDDPAGTGCVEEDSIRVVSF